MIYFTFFWGETKTSKSSVYFTITVHVSLDQPHFQCSISTWGLWLQYWTAQIWLLPTLLTSTHTIFSLSKKDSALLAFLVSQAHKSPSYLKAFAHVVPLCLEQFSCTLRINQHLNFHVILSVTWPGWPPLKILSNLIHSPDFVSASPITV